MLCNVCPGQDMRRPIPARPHQLQWGDREVLSLTTNDCPSGLKKRAISYIPLTRSKYAFKPILNSNA